MMWRLLVAVVLLWSSRADADTSLTCAQAPNLACANAADTITGPWTINGGSPIVLEGATDDTNETTISVTDPTADRTVTIPNADAVVPRSVSCSAGDFVSALNGTTGVFTCGTPSLTTLAWSGLTDPTASLSLTMDATETTTFTWSGNTSTANMFTFIDTTSNTGTGHLLDIHTVGSSAAKPLVVTAGGTANGVEMSSAGVLAKIGTGVNRASDVVCTTCVDTTDVANNAIDGTKIAVGTTNGDLLVYDGTDWARVASGAGVLKASGSAQTPAFSAISSSDIGAGDLASVLVWNEVCTASPCTLSAAPRTADTANVFWRTAKLRRVTSCGGINEYTLSGTTLTLCDSTGIGSGADGVQVTFEL